MKIKEQEDKNQHINHKITEAYKKSFATNYLQGLNFQGTQYENLAREGYIINYAGNAAVNIISKAIIQMRLFASNKDPENPEPLPINHPLQKLLARPNPKMSQSDFLKKIFGYYLIDGEAFPISFSPEDGPNAGVPRSLFPLSPKRVKQKDAQTPLGVKAVEYRFVQNDQVIPIDEMLHFRTFNPLNEAKGLSPLLSAALAVDAGNESMRWNVAMIQNDATPSAMISPGMPLEKGPFQLFKQAILKMITGAKNAKLPFITNGDVKYTQMGLSPKDLDYIKGANLSTNMIATVYNIGSQLLGDNASSTFNNVQEMNLRLHTDTARPLLQSFVDQLNIWLAPRFGDDVLIRIDDSQVDAIIKDKATRWAAIDSSQELKINEKRKLKGFDEVDDGDVIIITGSGQTLEQIIAGPQAPSLPSFGDTNTGHLDEEDDKKKSIEPEKTKEQLIFEEKASNVAFIQVKQLAKFTDIAIGKSDRLFTKVFRDEMDNIRKETEGSANLEVYKAGAEKAIDMNKPEWQKSYETVYKDIAFPFAIGTINSFDEVFGISKKESFEEVYAGWVQAYMAEAGVAEMVGEVISLSKTEVFKTIDKAIERGATVFETTKDIEKLYDGYGFWRAERIARTETMRARNFASDAGARSTGLPMIKKWVTVVDGRTRESHLNADGQVVNPNTPFTVNGQKLMFPVDSSLGASAGNTINCRCISVNIPQLDKINTEFFQ